MAFSPSNVNWLQLAAYGPGNNVGEQLASGLNYAASQQPVIAAQQQRNQTIAYLQNKYPDIAEAVRAGSMPLSTAWEQVQRAEQPQKPNFMNLGNGYLFNADNQQVIKPPEGYNQAQVPAIAQEFNFAKQQGFKGTFQDYQAYKAGLNKSGFMVEDTPEGMRVYQGDMSSAPSKMTEGQSKDINWLYRGIGSNQQLDKLETSLTSLGDDTASRLGTPGNYLKSEEYQQAEQAGKEFLAVVLRKDTGAAVTQSEMDLYGPMFLPRPGDKPAVIKQKSDARKRFLEGLGLGIPERMRKTVPGADTLMQPDPSAITTPTDPTQTDPAAAQPKNIVLPDGTQGTIRRTK